MAFPPTQMILSNSGEEIDLTTETTLLADKAIDLSIVEDWEPHCTTTAISEDAIPAILTAQNKKIPWGTQQEPPSLEQSQQPRPLSTNQIPGGTQQETPLQQHSNHTATQKPCTNYKPPPPHHHLQPPRTLIPDNHSLRKKEKKTRIHPQHLPKTTNKRLMPKPDPGPFLILQKSLLTLATWYGRQPQTWGTMTLEIVCKR